MVFRILKRSQYIPVELTRESQACGNSAHHFRYQLGNFSDNRYMIGQITYTIEVVEGGARGFQSSHRNVVTKT